MKYIITLGLFVLGVASAAEHAVPGAMSVLPPAVRSALQVPPRLWGCVEVGRAVLLFWPRITGRAGFVGFGDGNDLTIHIRRQLFQDWRDQLSSGS